MAGEREIDPTKVAAYIRWSTDDQGLGTTLEVQRDACRHFILSQGWIVHEHFSFVDDGYSGGTLERPALSTLRSLVSAGAIQAVVVFKIDRLSRSVVDTVNLVLKEWEGRCFVKSTREPIDTTTPAGKMFFYMLVSYAEWERAVIRERTLSGKRKRAEQGRNAGQKYPYGYRRGDGGAWALDGWDDAARQFTGPAFVVRRIFERWLTGVGAPCIAEELDQIGVRTPAGKIWRASHVRRILGNPNYVGTYVYGTRRVEGAMAAIVSPAEWERAQQLRQQRATGRSKAQAGRYLLSALAVCGRCGSPLVGSRGATRRYYVCAGRTPPGCCVCAYLDADALEQAVLAEVRAVVPGGPAGRFAHVQGELASAEREHERTEAHAAGELAQTIRRRKRLEDQFLDGSLDARCFQDLLRRVVVEGEEAARRHRLAQAALAQVRADMGAAANGAAGVDPWQYLQYAELKQLLCELVGELRIYQERTRPGSKRGNPNPVHLDWTPRLGEV